MDITYAEVESAEEILELQKLAYEKEAQLYPEESIPPMRQTLDELIQEINTQTVLQAIENEMVVGSVRAFVSEDVCYIGRLVVHPAYQRRGIGTALMQAIEGQFNTAKCFSLFTGSKSEDNIRLYQRLGYTIAQTKQASPHLTLVYMEKRRG